VFKSYIEVRNWLESFIPLVYGKEELGLRRIENLLEKLGDPQKKFKSIHVAGTSGKGTTAFYIAQLLQGATPLGRLKIRDQQSVVNIHSAHRNQNSEIAHFSTPSLHPPKIATRKLKIGLHVSPHLMDIRERMIIFESAKELERERVRARKLMPMRRFIGLVNDVKIVVDEIKSKQPHLTPSYFEILVAISFLYFARERVDWAVVEVGLGGRLDATNVLTPLVIVITNVGLDHTEILGNTIEEIALEKAGIIKSISNFQFPISNKKQKGVTKKQEVIGVPVVTGATGKALKVIEKVAKSKKALLITFNTRTFKISRKSDIRIDNNIYKDILRYSQNQAVLECMFLAVLAVLSINGDRIRVMIRRRIKEAFGTKFPGRFEEIDDGVILDGAHNPDKVLSLVNFVRSSKVKSQKSKVALVVAFKKGKDWKKMVDLLISKLPVEQVIATGYQAVTDTGKGSAVAAEEIRKYVEVRGQSLEVEVIKNSQEAIFSVLNSSKLNSNQLILVTGSLYLVGEARTLWYLPGF